MRKPSILLALGIMTVVLRPADWVLAGAHVDPADLCLAGLVAMLVISPGVVVIPFRRVPMVWLWITLGILMSIAYVLAPVNQPNLTDPARSLYQIVRYCWKAIAFYPLTVMLVGNDPVKRTTMLRAIVLAGALVGLHASIQGYSGEDPQAYFTGGNSLGGSLICPMVLALAGLANSSHAFRTRCLYGLAVVLIGRGLVFAESRGASVATLAGVMWFMGTMLTTPRARTIALRTAGGGVLAVVLLFATHPDLIHRPNVARILTAVQGTDDSNFQWRAQQRWPYFWAKIEANPWFGMGTNRDLSLGVTGNTPHNGYLSLACFYGIPATLIIVAFGGICVLNGWRYRRRSSGINEILFGLSASAAATGILVHNIVESTFVLAFVGNCFWTLAALTAAALAFKPLHARHAGLAHPIRRGRPVRRTVLRPVLGGDLRG